MKKFSNGLALVVLGAMLLSGCANPNDQSQTPGVVNTPAQGITPGGLETPLAGTSVVETPVTTQDVTVVPQATGTGTSDSNVPVTGDTACYPNRLSNIVHYAVVDPNQKEIGEVEGVVILRDAAGSMSSAAITTVAPEVTPDPNQGGGQMLDVSKLAAPSIAYLIVNLENDGQAGDQDVLVPFKAFSLPSAAASADAADTAEAVAGCRLTFAAGQAGLTGAPALDRGVVTKGELDLNQPTWDENFRTFWSGKGFAVPQSDAANGAQLGNPVVFSDKFDAIDVENANGDDLGEIEDFIVNPENGALQYGILGAGGFLGLGEKYIPVPASQMAWVDDTDDFLDPGKIVVNVSGDTFKSAPAFDDLDHFGPTLDWSTDVDTFWKGIKPGMQ
jgi:sporulation protein YlmC with PRC-barrel domain